MSLGFDLTILEELTSNAKQIQDDVLTEILKANANTEYLGRFLHGSSDKELFKKNVPVVTYEDFKPYIDRVLNGEPSNIISGNPISRFFLSSGTSSGNPKKIPANNISFDKVLFVYALRSLVMSKHFEGFKQGKMLRFVFTSVQSTTPCGLPIALVVASCITSGYFKNHKQNATSPNQVLSCSDAKQSLHRCRVGDVLQVTGFYNNTQQFRFVRRSITVLSVHVEPTTEEELVKALASATLILGSSDLMVTGFTCYSDISTVQGHYVFYLELKAKIKNNNNVLLLDNKVLVECCCVMEESLSALYRLFRKDGYIGALEIRVVQQGTFDSLMEFFISRGSSISQYKTPIIINSSEALKVLEDKVLARFFGDKTPTFDHKLEE